VFPFFDSFAPKEYHLFMVSNEEDYAKLASLTEEQAKRVLSLIEDLADLEAREDAEDLTAAREALTEYEKTGEAIPLSELEKRIDR